MTSRIPGLAALFSILLFSTPQTLAQDEPLKVGVTNVPPFAMTTDDGNWEGISIDLWASIAAGLDRPYELVPLSFGELLEATEQGRIDVAVGALTMTADREQRFDFSHPFYQTGLSIGIPARSEANLWSTFKALLSWQFVSVVAALAGLLLGVGVLVWLVERRHNRDQFGGSTTEGIGAGFWWAAVTMTTVGYGDKAPVTLPGRILGLIWMFAALIIVASFTAAITSALTVGNLRADIEDTGDLPGRLVATIGGTASERYLEERGIRHQTYPDLTSAMESVVDGDTDAIVYDRALMQYRNLQLGDRQLTILPGVFAEQLYALALPSGSDLRGPISEQVLRVTESEDWQVIQSSYLGSDSPGP